MEKNNIFATRESNGEINLFDLTATIPFVIKDNQGWYSGAKEDIAERSFQRPVLNKTPEELKRMYNEAISEIQE